MFSYISLEERVPAKHPLRKLRAVVDALLATMTAEFEAVYSRNGRPSVPSEMLLRQTPSLRDVGKCRCRKSGVRFCMRFECMPQIHLCVLQHDGQRVIG